MSPQRAESFSQGSGWLCPRQALGRVCVCSPLLSQGCPSSRGQQHSQGAKPSRAWGSIGIVDGVSVEAAQLGNHSTANPQTSPKMPAEKRRAGVTQGCHRGVHGWDTASTSPGSSQGWGAQGPQTQLGVGLREGRSLPRVSAGKLKIK